MRRDRKSDAFAAAERRLFDTYGVQYESRSLRLADPALDVVVREAGAGSPVLFIHETAEKVRLSDRWCVRP